jgi:hypothetical protein
MNSKIFKINSFLTLRLEHEKTQIYIKDDLFRQCKFLLLNNIYLDDVNDLLEGFNSVDEEIENLDRSLEGEEFYQDIDPETEFWAHCSNLQVWVENNYDSKLLHRNLAFPLLKVLAKKGDRLAKIKFKEEIIKRLETGVQSVVNYLFENNYTQYLSDDQLYYAIMERKDAETLLRLKNFTQQEYDRVENFEILDNNNSNMRFVVTNKQLTKLEIMIDGNFQFPTILTHFKNLKSLYIHIGEFVENLLIPITEIKNLEELRIFSYGETCLADSFEKFPNLKKIYIYGGSFETTPKTITKLKNLKVLIINRTKLSSLPESIDKLASLESINLRDCPLQILPETVTKLTKIKKLEINSNLLDSKITDWLASQNLILTSKYQTFKDEYLIFKKKM